MAEAPLVHVVDDDASVRDSLALLLESAGFSVAYLRFGDGIPGGRRRIARPAVC